MTIRIGANPIGWSNDDMQELGGETPLETCLAEAKEAGFEGMELGNKFPREADALKKALAPFGLACVGGLVFGRASDAATPRTEIEGAAPHLDLLKAMGSNVLRLRRDLERHPRRPLEAAVAAAGAEGRRWAEYGRAHDRVRRAASRPRACASSIIITWARSCSRRPTSTPSWRRPAPRCICCSTPATPPGAAPIRRRSPRRYRSRISHVHTKDVRTSVMAQSEGRGLELPRFASSTASIPCRATAWSISPPCSAELPGYSGWVVVEAEQDPKKAQPAHLCQDGLRASDEGAGRDRLCLTTLSSRNCALPGPQPILIRSGSAKRHSCHRARDDLVGGPHVPTPRQARPQCQPVHRVTPESAGWTYVGFEVHRLARRREPCGGRPATARSASSCSPARRASRPAARISA